MDNKETPIWMEIVKSAESLTDEEITQLVQALLSSHRLAINPRIVVQVQKLAEPQVDSFEQHVKETQADKVPV